MKSGYCTIMWNGRDHRASEMNHHQPYQRLVFIQRRWRCVCDGIGRESSIMSSFQKTKWLIPKVPFPSRPTKSSTRQKASGISQRKHIIFHQDNARLHVSLMTRQKLLHLGWEVLIHPLYSPDIAPSDFHLFRSLQNSLNEKISIPRKTVKGTCNSSLLKKIKSFGKMELWSCLKNGRR